MANQNNAIKFLDIWASGSGSNAEVIVKKFANHPHINVRDIWCNQPQAGIVQRMKPFGFDVRIFGKGDTAAHGSVYTHYKDNPPQLIVLAGYLWKVPADFIQLNIPIINIHPALLPQFGGKGMYGMHVHEAVNAAGVTKTGITIHWVNAAYDEGAIIFQAETPVLKTDSPIDIAHKVQALEHVHYANVIEHILMQP